MSTFRQPIPEYVQEALDKWLAQDGASSLFKQDGEQIAGQAFLAGFLVGAIPSLAQLLNFRAQRIRELRAENEKLAAALLQQITS